MYLKKTKKAPNSVSSAIFTETSTLLKLGKYPWGSSRRVYFDKPGKPGALRPITIPPFMDKVVQAAITMVLEAIYEPWFEKRNRSFGFRTSKGVHDAIYCITSLKARGLNMAIEGDIKAAYDKVNRKKLIEILSQKIKDRKFLKLLESRLNIEI
jgi:retron-type reverse transcriptase